MKLSELIEIGLNDLEKCEKSNEYEVDMSKWHEFNPNLEKCMVCFAGSVMAQTLDSFIGDDLTPSKFDEDWGRRLNALNQVRMGNLITAYGILHDISTLPVVVIDMSNKHQSSYCAYGFDPIQFKSWLRLVIDNLKEAGF
jgi:hypothetical protein